MVNAFPSRLPPLPLAVVKLRAAEQAEVNRMFYREGATRAETELRRLAASEAKEHERYDGPEWVLGDSAAAVEIRGQTWARPGDILLLAQDIAGVVSFYSVRIAHRCVAGAGVKPLMGWDEAFKYWRAIAGRPKSPLVVDATEEEPEPEVFGEIPPLPARSEEGGDIREDDRPL